MLNCILGVKQLDKFRYKLVHEEQAATRKGQSVTDNVKIYDVEEVKNK